MWVEGGKVRKRAAANNSWVIAAALVGTGRTKHTYMEKKEKRATTQCVVGTQYYYQPAVYFSQAINMTETLLLQLSSCLEPPKSTHTLFYTTTPLHQAEYHPIAIISLWI